MSRPRGRTPSERRWAMDGPSARAVGQEGEAKVPDVSRANKRGGRPLVLFAKESGSFQSHSPQPEGRAKPCRGQSPRIPCGEAASRGQLLARESGESLSSWNGLFPAVQCAVLITPYGVPLRGEAAPPYQLRERPNTLRYSNLRAPIKSITFGEA